MRVYLVLFTSIVGLSACGNDNGGPLPDASVGCASDLDNFTYVHGVVSAVTCANTGCHAGAGAANSGNLDLAGTEAEVYARLVGVATNDPEGATAFPLRVEANSSTTSYFYQMVSEPTPLGSSLGRMPPGGRLDPCDVAAIRDWIDSGAEP